MALTKKSIKYIIGTWDRQGVNPLPTDWFDEPIDMVHAVTGDDILISFHVLELLGTTESDMVLTGAVALRAIIRDRFIPESRLWKAEATVLQLPARRGAQWNGVEQ